MPTSLSAAADKYLLNRDLYGIVLLGLFYVFLSTFLLKKYSDNLNLHINFLNKFNLNNINTTPKFLPPTKMHYHLQSLFPITSSFANRHSGLYLKPVSHYTKMNIKPSPNHHQYLLTLSKMSIEQRFVKTLELTALTKDLFYHGLAKRFPDKTKKELQELYLQRLTKCYNRNY